MFNAVMDVSTYCVHECVCTHKGMSKTGRKGVIARGYHYCDLHAGPLSRQCACTMIAKPACTGSCFSERLAISASDLSTCANSGVGFNHSAPSTGPLNTRKENGNHQHELSAYEQYFVSSVLAETAWPFETPAVNAGPSSRVKLSFLTQGQILLGSSLLQSQTHPDPTGSCSKPIDNP